MKQKVSVPFMLLGILFNVCLIAANLLETKVIQVFGITVTAGLLVFPISYIINDCIAEVWGFRKARLIIWSGFAMNFFVVMLGLIAVALPAAPFWEGEGSFQLCFWDGTAYCGGESDSFSGWFVSQRLCHEPHESGKWWTAFLCPCHLVDCNRGNGRLSDILSCCFWRNYCLA